VVVVQIQLSLASMLDMYRLVISENTMV
jgi:hypothetical protein